MGLYVFGGVFVQFGGGENGGLIFFFNTGFCLGSFFSIFLFFEQVVETCFLFFLLWLVFECFFQKIF